MSTNTTFKAPKTINVKVSVPEVFDFDKYVGDDQRCYLEEVLDKRFPKAKIEVSCIGNTTINDVKYTTKDFNATILDIAIKRKKDFIAVKLTKI